MIDLETAAKLYSMGVLMDTDGNILLRSAVADGYSVWVRVLGHNCVQWIGLYVNIGKNTRTQAEKIIRGRAGSTEKVYRGKK